MITFQTYSVPRNNTVSNEGLLNNGSEFMQTEVVMAQFVV